MRKAQSFQGEGDEVPDSSRVGKGGGTFLGGINVGKGVGDGVNAGKRGEVKVEMG